MTISLSPQSGTTEKPILPAEAWQHPEHGQRWHKLGRCATCGDEKQHTEYFHCDACYEKLWPTIFDYDDD